VWAPEEAAAAEEDEEEEEEEEEEEGVEPEADARLLKERLERRRRLLAGERRGLRRFLPL